MAAARTHLVEQSTTVCPAVLLPPEHGVTVCPAVRLPLDHGVTVCPAVRLPPKHANTAAPSGQCPTVSWLQSAVRQSQPASPRENFIHGKQ
jgi:hypothetical protein